MIAPTLDQAVGSDRVTAHHVQVRRRPPILRHPRALQLALDRPAEGEPIAVRQLADRPRPLLRQGVQIGPPQQILGAGAGSCLLQGEQHPSRGRLVHPGQGHRGEPRRDEQHRDSVRHAVDYRTTDRSVPAV